MGLGPLKGPSAHAGAKHRNGLKPITMQGIRTFCFTKGPICLAEVSKGALHLCVYEHVRKRTCDNEGYYEVVSRNSAGARN